MKKIIIAALALVFITVTSIAQPAYSDLINALNYSQNGPAHAAFDGSAQYYNYYWNRTSGYISGSSVSRTTPGRRAATNMSNVGLKISSSGYNQGANLARLYAERRAERARLAAERRQRMVDSYMQTQYEKNQNREASWQMFIANNSQAKPFSQETINDFVSNGLPGNVIIDDNGSLNLLPEVLLEGTEGMPETLEERLKKMNDYEIDQFAEELNNKLDNGEDLSDEEWDFLIARENEREARIAQLEEEQRKVEEEVNKRLLKQTETIKNIDVGL